MTIGDDCDGIFYSGVGIEIIVATVTDDGKDGQNIRPHQPRKKEKRHDRSIWKRWECTGASDGKLFPSVCRTGAWHAPVYGN